MMIQVYWNLDAWIFIWSGFIVMFEMIYLHFILNVIKPGERKFLIINTR